MVNVTKPESLSVGMIVRVPIDVGVTEALSHCRDFRVGRLHEIDGDHCVVQFKAGENDPFQQAEFRISHTLVRRCLLRPGAPFQHAADRSNGKLLDSCAQFFEPGKWMLYYAFVDGKVITVCEKDLLFESHTQSPQVETQLIDQEFHNPVWREKRDKLLKSILEIESTTFGIEELLGSRVLLLPHQAETIARILGDPNCRYALADEVGLGKTIEACVILKGLKRRNPALKTVIIAPPTLVRQWANELSQKFWLDFSLPTVSNRFEFDPNGPGIILSSQDVQQYPKLGPNLLKRHWDLLIVDEAHRLHRNPALHGQMVQICKQIRHCLILSATPILRRASEYLSLLRLMNPSQYEDMLPDQFEALLANQRGLREALAFVGRALNETDFDPQEFHDELDPFIPHLVTDSMFPQLMSSVVSSSRDRGLRAAQDAHSYLSENYRIENRVIRNRRASLTEQVALPVRVLDDSYSYEPTVEEREVLVGLAEYLEAAVPWQDPVSSLASVLLFAAASGYTALQNLIELRLAHVSGGQSDDASPTTVPPFELPTFPDEHEYLYRLQRDIKRWADVETQAIEHCLIGRAPSADARHRSLQSLRAVYASAIESRQKVLVFAYWDSTHHLLEELFRKHFGQKSIAIFKAGMDAAALQVEADRFQSQPSCRIMLSDETGGEGRNFQIAHSIIHVDLPWSPAQIEQRIGRVDRIGRSGKVVSVVPYARKTVEHDLFNLWREGFRLFDQSMSGMEIVLEDVQDQIAAALTANPRDGLAQLFPELAKEAIALREVVEKERYAEESASQIQKRSELATMLNRYRDGKIMGDPLREWADLAGLKNYTQQDHETGVSLTIFDPKEFVQKSITNAKFVRPPNMEEALRRSRRQARQIIRGTFDREVAVQREDIVFFAPGEVWTDSILENALYADRGQCAAVARVVPGLASDWEGFDCLYSIRIDPRPLLANGGDPVHLFHALGYLTESTYRVLVGVDGIIKRKSETPWRETQISFRKETDVHLGRRNGADRQIDEFIERYASAHWRELVRSCLETATSHLMAEYEFTKDLADEAQQAFKRMVTGQRAANLWLRGDPSTAEIDAFEKIAELLVRGIAQPRFKLESVAYWWLRAQQE